VGGAAPSLAGTRGVPPDQFSLHSSDGRLLKDQPRDCDNEAVEEARLAFLDIPLASFGDTLREVAQQRYTPLPGVKSHYIANRFTDRYLVYGSLGRYRRAFRNDRCRPLMSCRSTARRMRADSTCATR
jgi:hypothetical protein